MKRAIIHYVRANREFNGERLPFGRWAWSLVQANDLPCITDGDAFSGYGWGPVRFITGFWYTLHDVTFGDWASEVKVTILPPWRWL